MRARDIKFRTQDADTKTATTPAGEYIVHRYLTCRTRWTVCDPSGKPVAGRTTAAGLWGAAVFITDHLNRGE